MERARFAHCRAVCFDIDDTLYDFHASVRLTLARMRDAFPALARRPLDAVEARYWAANESMSEATKLALIDRDPFLYRRATWVLYLEREAAGIEPGDAASPPAVARFFADSASAGPGRDDVDLAARLARAFGDWRFAHLREAAYPLARETVADVAASGRRVGIISNGPAALQRAKFRALGLDALVPEPHVLISGEFGERKPHRAIFEAAASRLGVAPEDAVFVGDSVECDVACKAIGMCFIYFDAARAAPPDFKALCGFEPDAVAHDYAGVRQLLGLSPA